jgi:hypothetical protein
VNLFDLHDRIKAMLPSLESYSDPFIHMERNDIAEEGGPLDQQHAKVLGGPRSLLLEMQESQAEDLGWRHDPKLRLLEVLRVVHGDCIGHGRGR